MVDNTHIYVLVDPFTKAVRYVGKSDNPRKRFSGHLLDKTKCHRKNWIIQLRNLGIVPVLKIIDTVPTADWQFYEKIYIQHFKNLGCELVNSTEGGDGCSNPSEETLCKMREAMTGRKHSPETIAKRIASMLGQKRSLETRLKMSIAAQGKKFSAEHREALRKFRLGKKTSEETKLKQSLSSRRLSGKNHPMFGKHHSAETRAKMTASQIRRNVKC
jgi:hypothetical protein